MERPQLLGARGQRFRTPPGANQGCACGKPSGGGGHDPRASCGSRRIQVGGGDGVAIGDVQLVAQVEAEAGGEACPPAEVGAHTV